MRRAAEIVLAAALLTAQPLAAQTTGTGQALVRSLADEENAGAMARVVTDVGRPAECLAPLAVTRIDGEDRTVSAKGFLIEPGMHSINGRATLDLTSCPLGDPRLTIDNATDLEVEFEAGNTYFIGYFHPPGSVGEWKLMVWNVEANPLVESIDQDAQTQQ
jgi:hypothetical protein